MKDSEIFYEFNSKLSKIVNSSFNLGEPIPQHKVVKRILRSFPKRFRSKVVAIEEHQDLNSLSVEELVGNLQTYEANHCLRKNGKEVALKSSKSVDSSSESECDSKDAEFEKYFIKKFKKMLKNKKAKKDGNNKAPYKTKSVPEKNSSKESTKPIQCFECQCYGHNAAKCANRKEKSKGKALNMSWEEDTDEEKSEPESLDNDFKNCVAFMALSIVSSMQGSSDRESKSDDNSDSDNFSDDDKNWETAYKKLLQDSIRMSKISKKRALKLKEMESQNSSLTAQLEELHAKVSQLEDQNIISSNNLIAAGKESELLKQ